MSRSGQRTSSSRPQQQRRNRHANNDGLIPVLARKVREVEAKAADGKKLGPTNRTKFQVIAFLMREERARAKADSELTDAARAEQLKRLDGIATILAKTAARDTSLISLLESEAPPTATAQKMRRDWLLESGTELSPDDLIITIERPAAKTDSVIPPELAEKQVVPQSVKARQLSNPFLAPDFSRLTPAQPTPRRRLDSWELLGPLFKSFEYGAGGQAASMDLPPAPAIDRYSPPGLELMHHQARFVESVRQGHRTFLLADEPGLGKTAQSVLAASVAGAYPLLAVVPNVVKMNWAREVERWTPQRRATVIHGDGEGLDAFADVVIVNYEVLDRHLSWLSTLGFKGMVVDEAHFIKNLHSQRSRLVLGLADAIRSNTPDPLLLALTGTPLINDIDDFRAIWQLLGWIDGSKPTAQLMERLEETGLTPAEFGFYAAAREAVIDMGIVRRRKLDVAADLPSRRVVDLPVELDGDLGRSIRQAEKEL
ncbi:protein, SNF2 family, partial [Leifsonia aquatica ATCC 14665]